MFYNVREGDLRTLGMRDLSKSFSGNGSHTDYKGKSGIETAVTLLLLQIIFDSWYTTILTSLRLYTKKVY